MTKYDEQFKTSVVRQYLDGVEGFKALAKRHGLSYGMVRRWVALFRTHGEDGLRKKSGRYRAEFKLSVLRHMWDNGLSYGQAAAQFNIRSPGHVSLWERGYRRVGLEGLVARPRGKPKSMPITPPQPESKSDDETK